MSPKERKAKKPFVSSDTNKAMDNYAVVLVSFIKSNEFPEWVPVQEILQNIRRSDWKSVYQLVAGVSNRDAGSVRATRVVSQLGALVLKYPFPCDIMGDGLTPKERAWNTFQKYEEKCRVTNRRFLRLRAGLWSKQYSPLIEQMRKWLHFALKGDEIPPFEKICERASFGKGSSVGVHGARTSLHRKMEAKAWTCTPAVQQLAREALWSNHQIRILLAPTGHRNPGYAFCDKDAFQRELDKRFSLVSFNELDFVPKNAKTERSIAIEPLLNGYVQKGIDLHLRDILCRWGHDLTDQTPNQRLARRGSIEGSHATVDLSSSSDTLSKEMVRYLLPTQWYALLNRARATQYKHGGRTYDYHKFVSMGNGFCFPLQTLLYSAAVRAVAKMEGLNLSEGFEVYGDDIVVPSRILPKLIGLLKFLGMVPNEDKTFASGPFRESCGADWYEGQDVRPVYLDFHLNRVSDLMIFHNATRRSNWVASLVEDVRPLLRSLVPAPARLLRPEGGYGKRAATWEDPLYLSNLNGAFDVPMDEFMGSRSAVWVRDEWRWSWKEYLFRAVPDETGYNPNTEYLAFLFGYREGKATLRFRASRAIHVV